MAAFDALLRGRSKSTVIVGLRCGDIREGYFDIDLSYGDVTSDKQYHTDHSFGYVLAGSDNQTVQGRATVTAKVGEVLYDGPGEIHETTNSSPAKVIIFRIIEKGKEVTTYVP